jgi:hypothetical protein
MAICKYLDYSFTHEKATLKFEFLRIRNFKSRTKPIFKKKKVKETCLAPGVDLLKIKLKRNDYFLLKN